LAKRSVTTQLLMEYPTHTEQPVSKHLARVSIVREHVQIARVSVVRGHVHIARVSTVRGHIYIAKVSIVRGHIHIARIVSGQGKRAAWFILSLLSVGALSFHLSQLISVFIQFDTSTDIKLNNDIRSLAFPGSLFYRIECILSN